MCADGEILCFTERRRGLLCAECMWGAMVFVLISCAEVSGDDVVRRNAADAINEANASSVFAMTEDESIPTTDEEVATVSARGPGQFAKMRSGWQSFYDDRGFSRP